MVTDEEFDSALIAAAFVIAGAEGWRRVSVAAAARQAGLALDRARARFPGRSAILLRFGSQVDQAALSGASLTEGSPRDRLFDLLMRCLDAMKPHRAGVAALLRALPADPVCAMLLAAATLRSMGWMLEAAGVPAHGVRGRLRAKGLQMVWLYAVRAFVRDDSPDLSAAMSALDQALARAEQAAQWVGFA